MPRRTSARAGAALAVTLSLTAGLACAQQDSGDRASAVRSPAGEAAPSLPSSLTEQRLDWSRCPSPNSAQGDGGGAPRALSDGTEWECATLRAPLDYGDPDGRTLGIEMVRAKARTGDKGGSDSNSDSGGDPSGNGAEGADGRRIGSLLFNFGGPGGSGVASLPQFGADYEKLRSRYDLVSFDPRGVGRSAGVSCLDGKQLDAYFAGDATPETAEEKKRFFDRQSQFAKGCEERAAALLPHLTTENTARDMDLMREVLGDSELHYFGVSYGTELGGVYAHLFPRRVGRAAFDAVSDPDSTPEEGSLSQAEGFQLALDNYLKACAEHGDACPVGDDPDGAEQRIARLLKRLDRQPMRTSGKRKLTESLAANGIAQALYSQDMWDHLTSGLEQALDRKDGTGLLSLADTMNGRNRDGTYSTLQSSLTAVRCADARQRYGREDIEESLPRFREASGVFGPMSAWGMAQCHDWPVDGRQKRPDVSAAEADPILIVGTTGDPATPYAGARKMEQRLGGDVGVVLTYRGEGHGAYSGGSPCVRNHVNTYLLRGEPPADGTVCS